MRGLANTVVLLWCWVWTMGWLGPMAVAQDEPAASARSGAAEDDHTQPPRDLGPPLVDHPENLKRLHPKQPVWVDPKQKAVVFQGETCRASYGLEFFVTMPGREYEAVIVSNVRPSLVHAGLMAVGAQPGSPVKFLPKIEPASGTEIEIEVRWKDPQGKIQKARAQDWIRDIKTQKALDLNWVFAGSKFSDDDGKRVYQADFGDFISVANVPIATLDLPIRSMSDLDSRQFECFPGRVPPQGTPVTLILKPKLPQQQPKSSKP
ncbi:MAG: YdjY domain-containing protein [Thermoguttaceae bacterium]|jgi:hypothetical protein|nr:YdjY domain-containing protein [Thermoguttaceae bacterium]